MSALTWVLTVRKDAGLYGYERALRRVGLEPVAGVDEAGRGACAGPLVAAAVVLPDGKRGQVPGLADSKLLTARAREKACVEVKRRALAWSVVVVEHDECPVDGLEVPGLAIWKGDRVAACIAAASVIAKVTRDRIMTEWHEEYPAYDFLTHKGYITPTHTAALEEHGPCPIHRRRFVNVRRAAAIHGEAVPSYGDELVENGPDDAVDTVGHAERVEAGRR